MDAKVFFVMLLAATSATAQSLLTDLGTALGSVFSGTLWLQAYGPGNSPLFGTNSTRLFSTAPANSVQLSSFTFGGTIPYDIAGPSTGNSSFSPLTLTRAIDVYSPSVFYAFASGTILDSLIISSFTGGSALTARKTLSLTFSPVLITAVTHDVGTAPGTALVNRSFTETLRVAFQTVAVAYADPSTGVTNVRTWNQVSRIGG